jgi:surfactin synthase thioesterase subunit
MTPSHKALLVRAHRTASAPIRLLCLPHAGGGASTFRRWGEALAGVDVWAVQFPGHGARFRERPLTLVSEMVAELTDALRSDLDTPFALFGHSMGALVAFELAREMRRRGWPAPVLLFISGCAALHHSVEGTPISHLPDAEFVSEIRRLYDGIPDEVLAAPEFLAMVLPVLRADMHALESYRYTEEPPLVCPISCFGGRLDTHATPERLAAWRVNTRGSFSLRIFPGGHFFIDSDRPAVLEAVADDLRPWGARAR